jgi:hypothetical protein
LKDYCHRECAESKRSKYLEVFEEVSEGVRAEIFPKGLEDFSIKLRRDRIFEAVEEKLKRASALKSCKKAQRRRCKKEKFRGRTLCSFHRNCQGGIGRSKFSMEDSRSLGIPQILQRSKKVMVSVFLSASSGEIGP